MKKLFMTSLLGGMMALSMTPAYALQDQKVPTVKASITKTFELPAGVSSINETFKFTAKPTNGGPKATIKDLTFDQLGEVSNGQYTITKSSDITFDPFSHAGVYTYEVTEMKGNDTRVTYSTDHYVLRVYVANGEQGLYVKEMTAQKGETKADTMKFTNTYAAKSSLTISKDVEGDYGDRSKAFSFTIRFNKAPLTNVDSYKASNGATVKAGEDYTFNLKHGENLTFNDLPVGTTYTVKENAHDGYSTKVKVNNNNELENDTSGKQTISDQGNTVAFTNTENKIVVTGMVMKSLPYIAMSAVAMIGFAFLTIFRRKTTH